MCKLPVLIWTHCFLWMSMMTGKVVQIAHSYFASILATISKYRQKIQDLMKKGKTAEESLERNIPKKHSKGKLKKRRLKDNKKCLHNEGNVGKYNVAPDLANIDPKHLDPVSGGKERKSQEDNYIVKEVPSNGLLDTNSIVHKSRPPERVKKRFFEICVAMAVVVTFFKPVCGASAESFRNRSSKVGKNVSMEIPEDIAGDIPFWVKYTPNNNSSEVLMLCTYLDGSLSTSNPNNSHLQGISCLPKGVFISSAELRHAGTFSIILFCTEHDCPRSLIYNLSITGKDEPLIRPSLTEENGTTSNKTDVGGGGGSSYTNIPLAITITLVVLIVILVGSGLVIYFKPDLCKRILNRMNPRKKSTTSSNDADTADGVQCRMISV